MTHSTAKCLGTSRAHALATLIGMMVVTPSGPLAREQAQPAPSVVKIGNAEVGLIYSVETLAALVARQPPGTVSSRITDAIRQQTPVVVMWSIPTALDRPPAPRPFSVAITERHEEASLNPQRIEPLWIQYDAADLARLDSRTRFGEVGAMAAFRPSAFVRGRKLAIYSERPTDNGGTESHTRYGWIEWEPARDQER